MVTLFPRIESEDDTIGEFIFLIDRSGSMAGIIKNLRKFYYDYRVKNEASEKRNTIVY